MHNLLKKKTKKTHYFTKERGTTEPYTNKGHMGEFVHGHIHWPQWRVNMTNRFHFILFFYSFSHGLLHADKKNGFVTCDKY